jgi:hypothetical protein
MKPIPEISDDDMRDVKGFANPYRHGDGADSKRNPVTH